jgi:glycosyltransferase involved in cell wall biosynthesis
MEDPAFEVIVIDDASDDGTKEFLEKKYCAVSAFKILHVRKCGSTTELYNIGYRHASGDVVAYVDDDCTVGEKWISELAAPYEDPEVMVTGGVTFIGKTSGIFNAGKINGCNMSLRRKIFDKFSFDENLIYSRYFDERDIINRIAEKGYKTVIADRAIVYHFQNTPNREERGLGADLNRVYCDFKKLNLPKFYVNLAIYLFFRKCPDPEYTEIIGQNTAYFVHKALNNMRWYRRLYILGLIFLLLPLKAKVKNMEEEKSIGN